MWSMMRVYELINIVISHFRNFLLCLVLTVYIAYLRGFKFFLRCNLLILILNIKSVLIMSLWFLIQFLIMKRWFLLNTSPGYSFTLKIKQIRSTVLVWCRRIKVLNFLKFLLFLGILSNNNCLIFFLADLLYDFIFLHIRVHSFFNWGILRHRLWFSNNMRRSRWTFTSNWMIKMLAYITIEN